MANTASRKCFAHRLISRDIKMNRKSSLLAVARSGDAERIEELIKKGADVNVTDKDGSTALHWAAQEGDVHLCSVLLKAGADVNAGDRDGVTPLEVAASGGGIKVFRLLLKSGADVGTSADGFTPLHAAAAAGTTSQTFALKGNHFRIIEIDADPTGDIALRSEEYRFRNVRGGIITNRSGFYQV